MFFFFKQKTAYEMRISDWSSDVCSSDLAIDDGPALFRWYFTDKWRKTVHAKKAAWPDTDISGLLEGSSLMAITTAFAERQTEYGALDPYFAEYTLAHETLSASPTPHAHNRAPEGAAGTNDHVHGLQA